MADPYFNEIMEGLERLEDDKLFEECVVPLLQPSWPNLVPVPGGGDRGLDGAWTDSGGPGLLITTTNKRVIVNLRKNLKSHLKSGGTRRRVLIATSRKLTASQCRKLDEEAKSLGFTLAHHPYSKQAIAELLCNNPVVCKRLLGLPGRMSALGRVPRGARLFLDLPLIGRHEDLDWLRRTRGDRLLIGQPGSGKTFLLQALAREDRGLFLLDTDLEHLAEALWKLRPKAVIVDDAHVNAAFLTSLVSLRQQIAANFDIIAGTWPGARDELQDRLALPDGQVHELKPLRPEHILEIVNAVGVHGPNPLLHQLVRQSIGRPGLAAYLAHLCLQGDVLTVWSGDALARRLKETVRTLVDPKAVDVLAAFSVGGASGIPWGIVAKVFSTPIPELRLTMSRLAAGGLISDIGGRALAVQPEALRSVLVRDTFFAGGASLDIHELLPHVPDRNGAAMTIIGAYARGAKIPSEELLAALTSDGVSIDAWRQFAWSDPDNARIVLSRFPEKLTTLAAALLDSAPELTIPRLLECAATSRDNPEESPEHPLRILRDWTDAAEPGSGEPVRRREHVLDGAIGWLRRGGDRRTGMEALRLAFSIRFEDHQQHPANDYAFAFRIGVVSETELRVISGFWPRALAVLQEASISDWRPLLKLLEQWCFPQQIPAPISAEAHRICQFAASDMLRDLASIASDQPGVQFRLRRLSRRINVELQASIDSEFLLLYPEANWEPSEWREELDKHEQDAVALVEKWISLSPEHVARKLCDFMHYAEMAGIRRPERPVRIAELLADRASHVAPWLDAMASAGAPSDCVFPFLNRAAIQDDEAWTNWAESHLTSPVLRHAAVAVTLLTNSSPESLVQRALDQLSGMHAWVEHVCRFRKLPERRLIALLTHGDSRVAAAATEGSGRQPMSDDVRGVWRNAVIKHLYNDDALTEFFKADPALAFEWLRHISTKECPLLVVTEAPIADACAMITKEQRAELLEQIEPVYAAAAVLNAVIAEDIDVYRTLLRNSSKRSLHLLPLRILPEGVWPARAAAAIEYGYSAEEIADSVSISSLMFSVSALSKRYEQLAERFDTLRKHPDARLHEIARIGHTQAIRDRDAALRRERQFEAETGQRQ